MQMKEVTMVWDLVQIQELMLVKWMITLNSNKTIKLDLRYTPINVVNFQKYMKKNLTIS